jgi:hypothetical protein
VITAEVIVNITACWSFTVVGAAAVLAVLVKAMSLVVSVVL